jgi:hypothetical protein
LRIVQSHNNKTGKIAAARLRYHSSAVTKYETLNKTKIQAVKPRPAYGPAVGHKPTMWELAQQIHTARGNTTGDSRCRRSLDAHVRNGVVARDINATMADVPYVTHVPVVGMGIEKVATLCVFEQKECWSAFCNRCGKDAKEAQRGPPSWWSASNMGLMCS